LKAQPKHYRVRYTGLVRVKDLSPWEMENLARDCKELIEILNTPDEVIIARVKREREERLKLWEERKNAKRK